ncbi:MAG: 6-phosphofructokinase, partial [Candidatus Theseobacter exili]|nr:6-phosphofructokinase [Candidatus Theseobacter exili]
MKKIGIITSGGDCGGLNAVVKGAAYMASSKDIELYVIPNGYAGLYNLVEIEHLVQLTPFRLDQFQANFAGSEAGHSRVKIARVRLNMVRPFGATGRLILSGPEAEIDSSAEAAIATIDNINAN